VLLSPAASAGVTPDGSGNIDITLSATVDSTVSFTLTGRSSDTLSGAGSATVAFPAATIDNTNTGGGGLTDANQQKYYHSADDSITLVEMLNATVNFNGTPNVVVSITGTPTGGATEVPYWQCDTNVTWSWDNTGTFQSQNDLGGSQTTCSTFTTPTVDTTVPVDLAMHFGSTASGNYSETFTFTVVPYP